MAFHKEAFANGVNVKELTQLLQYVSPNRPKEIILHWFTKGYKKRLGVLHFSEWPFEESEDEFNRKFDSVFFIQNVQGGNLMGWSSDKGRYATMDESDK